MALATFPPNYSAFSTFAQTDQLESSSIELFDFRRAELVPLLTVDLLEPRGLSYSARIWSQEKSLWD